MIEIDVKTVKDTFLDVEFGLDLAIIKHTEGKNVKTIIVAREFARLAKPGCEHIEVVEKPKFIEVCKVK